MKLYLSGPMRGYELFNFPAFQLCKLFLEDEGYKVISPADMDLKLGFDPGKPLNKQPSFYPSKLLIKDAQAIIRSDAVVLMPNWEQSSGCNMEVAIALFLNKPCYEL